MEHVSKAYTDQAAAAGASAYIGKNRCQWDRCGQAQETCNTKVSQESGGGVSGFPALEGQECI